MPKTFPLVALWFGVLVAVAGCRSADRVENRFDPPSLMRLNMLEDTATASVACRVSPLPETLPTGMVELARSESSLLLEIPKTGVDALGKIPGLERASVWGSSAAVAKMDGRVKEALLAAWDRGDTRPMPLLARFAEGTADIRGALEAQGVAPRTVAGTVVTLDADPDEMLRLIAIPELLGVSLPRTLEPLEESN